MVPGDAARILETMSDREIIDTCMNILREIFADTYEVPEPVGFIR